MIGCWHSSLLLHAFYLEWQLGLLGHHASKCIIDGPRAEGHAPLSPLHDGECSHAHLCLKIPCHTLLALCCCQLQDSAGRNSRADTWSADRPNTISLWLYQWSMTIPFGRWCSHLVGDAPQCSEKHP